MKKNLWLSAIIVVGIACMAMSYYDDNAKVEEVIELPNSANEVSSYYRNNVYKVEFNGAILLGSTDQIPSGLIQPPATWTEVHKLMRLLFIIHCLPNYNNPVRFGDTLSISVKAYFGDIYNSKQELREAEMDVVFDYKLMGYAPNDNHDIEFNVWIDMGNKTNLGIYVLDVTCILYLNYTDPFTSDSELIQYSSDRLAFDYSSGMNKIDNTYWADFIFVALIIILVLGLNFILMSQVSYHRRETHRQSTELAKSLIESGIFTPYNVFATQIAEKAQIEEYESKIEEEESQKKKRHEGESFETQIDSNAPKKYYYIPGYYDTTVTFPRFILIATVLFIGICIAAISLINYLLPINSPDIPFLFYAYLIILGGACVFCLVLYVAYSAIRLQKLSFKDIEKAGYAMPKIEDKSERDEVQSYAVAAIEKIDSERIKPSRIIGGITWAPMMGINIIIIVFSIFMIGMLFFAAFAALFALDLFVSLSGSIFSQIFNLETIEMSINLFEFVNTLSLQDMFFFAINVLLVVLLIKSIFIRQYNFIANISNGILFAFLYSSVLGGIPYILLGFGIFQALFALIVVPRQDSKSHHYTDLKKENHHYSNSRLYLAERLQSQRWYIYIPVLCMALASILSVQNALLYINSGAFVVGFLLDNIFYSSRKKLGLRASKRFLCVFITLGIISSVSFIINIFSDRIVIPDFGIGLVIALKTFMTISGNISDVEIPKEKSYRMQRFVEASKDKINSVRTRNIKQLSKDQKPIETVVYFVTPEALKMNSGGYQNIFGKFQDLKLPELANNLVQKFVEKISISAKKIPPLIQNVAKKLKIDKPLRDKFGNDWKSVLATEIVIPELVDAKVIERKKM
jgi:hypothetical protein